MIKGLVYQSASFNQSHWRKNMVQKVFTQDQAFQIILKILETKSVEFAGNDHPDFDSITAPMVDADYLKNLLTDLTTPDVDLKAALASEHDKDCDQAPF